jgi:hypothetical protein
MYIHTFVLIIKPHFYSPIALPGRKGASGATNGSTQKNAIPFSPFLPRTPTGGGGGNQTGKRGEAATASANRPVFPPTESWGKTEPEQTTAGAKRPTIRRRIGGRHDGRMPAGRSPVADLHQRAGGRRRRSRRDGSEADPESTRPAPAGGARRGIQDSGQIPLLLPSLLFKLILC